MCFFFSYHNQKKHPSQTLLPPLPPLPSLPSPFKTQGLVAYFSSGPIIAMVWEGKDAIKTGRVLLGATNPAAAVPGTIRGDMAISVGRNICHGSDGKGWVVSGAAV
jgi:nucleoside diphosphate kinase